MLGAELISLDLRMEVRTITFDQCVKDAAAKVGSCPQLLYDSPIVLALVRRGLHDHNGLETVETNSSNTVPADDDVESPGVS